MRKKALSITLVLFLLLSLTACGKQADKPAETTPTTTTTAPAEPQDENYVAAMAKLEEGKWQEAYDLFQKATDPNFGSVFLCVDFRDGKPVPYGVTP